MGRNHFSPKLHKRLVFRQDDYKFYTVNALTVRNVAQPDEEFGNFALAEDFENLIPEGEVWISEKTFPQEGLFFIADALTRLKELERGVAEDKAYTAGLDAEQALREKVNGMKQRAGHSAKHTPPELYQYHYITLPDVKAPVEVWVIDGNLARTLYKTDYTEGGHGYVYSWCPRTQIWIDCGVDDREIPFILAHEYLESRLMRDEGLGYDPAHEICSKMEFELRKGGGIKLLLAPGRRKLHKRDLHRLTAPEVFEAVVKTYVKKA